MTETAKKRNHKPLESGVVTLEDKVKLELDIGHNGWKCSGCGLRIDAIGRPIFNKEIWKISCTSTTWIENKPMFKFCPKCGKEVENNYG